MNEIIFGLLGGVFGFLLKSIIDFYISSNKDGLKDLKIFLQETIKSIDETADNLERDIFDFYSKKHDSIDKQFKILKIQNNFKRLGVLIAKYNSIVTSETKCSNIFSDELRLFRSVSTLDIHNKDVQDFKTLDKLLEVQVRYLALKNKIFSLKSEIGLYQISQHTTVVLSKFKKYLTKKFKLKIYR